jgi:hypothetical protein
MKIKKHVEYFDDLAWACQHTILKKLMNFFKFFYIAAYLIFNFTEGNIVRFYLRGTLAKKKEKKILSA